MIKRKYAFPSCSATAGNPFEGGPKCPLYLRTDAFLRKSDWNQVFYNAFKTGSGDLCNTKYKRLEKSKMKDGTQDVLSMLEVSIEGTKRTCHLTAVVSTYHPKNILKNINHECEKGIIEGLEEFLGGQLIDTDNQ